MNKRKRLLAILLSLALAVGMCPAFANANEVCALEGREITDTEVLHSKVANLTAKPNGAHSVKLNWSEVDGVDGYRVYRYNASTSEYAFVKSVASTASSCIVYNLAAGKVFTFKVLPYVLDEDGEKIDCFAASVKGGTLPTALSGLRVSPVSVSSVKLTWNKNATADGYRVFKYNASTGNYVLKKTIANSSVKSYTATGLAAGKRHVYKVRPYSVINGAKHLGTGMIKAGNTNPKQVINVKASAAGTNSIKVTWSKRTCTKYQVRYSRSSTFSGYTTATVWGNSKKITGLKSGKTYYVKVRAVKTSDNATTAYGKWSVVKKATTKKAASSNSGSSSTGGAGNIVYITATGTKYHFNKNCRGLSNANAIYQTTLAAARADGFTLCGYED